MSLTAHDWIAVGLYIAAVWYLRHDVNGLGAKTRRMIAEQIIQAKDDPDFPAIVRRLLG